VLGLFFNQWPAATRRPHAIDGLAHEQSRQFGMPAANRLFVHAGDLGQQPITAVPQALGFVRHKPPPLVLIQAAEQRNRLAMHFAFRVVNTLLAQVTATRW